MPSYPQSAGGTCLAGDKDLEQRRVLMIGLDAADIDLIEAWMQQGLLPNLAALRNRGSGARLSSAAEWLVGAPWPCFFASRPPEQIGMYHYLMWRADRMSAERPTPAWLPVEPFWRRLPRQGVPVVALDVPLCYAPGDFGGIEISGWATHELLQQPASTPPDLLARTQREFGRAPFDEEGAHLLSVAEFLQVRDQCVDTAGLVADLALRMLREHPWRLAMICFSSTHRAGHLLWDRSILKGAASQAELEEVDGALRKVYEACDAAVGRLVEAHPDADVLVYSLHGMGVNEDRTSMLPEMLRRVLDGASAGMSHGVPAQPSLARRLRALLPDELRSRVKKHLPRALQDWLTVFWRSGQVDWSQTRAFVVFCDHDGYVRINLRGRERDGIVPPEEYEPLCRSIAQGLATFADADTGEPVVRDVGLAPEIFTDTPTRTLLPDLIVRWTKTPARTHRAIRSPLYGEIAWPTPGRHPLARSGNHHRVGFVFGAGPQLGHGALPSQGDVMDLAPTALDLLGTTQPPDFHGRSLRRDAVRGVHL